MGESPLSGLSLNSDEARGAAPPRRSGLIVMLALFLAVALGLGFLGYELRGRAAAIEQQLATVSARADEAAARSRQALERASAAEGAARAAAEGRASAEAVATQARGEADGARREADAAREEAAGERERAARAQAEADRVRKQAEAELNRLEGALSQIAETRRTALGLVMTLGSDYLKFEFDKAELRPEDRELLSRVAGILMTSSEYTVSVNGHTDDVGSDEYNQALSERRAQAVRDYLLKAGLPAEILDVAGHGKTRPLVKGTSPEARARNRRVELGIVNTRIVYPRSAGR